jgi:hypothetical protein
MDIVKKVIEAMGGAEYLGKSVICKVKGCHHPSWAHRQGEGSRTEAGTWFDGDIMECCWDVDGEACKCREFKPDHDEYARRRGDRK